MNKPTVQDIFQRLLDAPYFHMVFKTQSFTVIRNDYMTLCIVLLLPQSVNWRLIQSILEPLLDISVSYIHGVLK